MRSPAHIAFFIFSCMILISCAYQQGVLETNAQQKAAANSPQPTDLKAENKSS